MASGRGRRGEGPDPWDQGVSQPDQHDGGWDEEPGGPGPTQRAKVTLALVLVVAMAISLLLCCMAARPIAELWRLELPPP